MDAVDILAAFPPSRDRRGREPMFARNRWGPDEADPDVVCVYLTREVWGSVDAPVWHALLQRYRWHAQESRGRWVMRSNTCAAKGAARQTVYAHVLVALWFDLIDFASGLVVDHVEHYELDAMTIDNRRSNLRAATVQQNAAAARHGGDGESGLRGVIAVRDKWGAQIRVDGKRRWLGVFPDRPAAAAAYAAAAREHFGAFAPASAVAPAMALPDQDDLVPF